MSADKFRGHEIAWRGKVCVFVDTGDGVAEAWEALPCGHCLQHNTPEGHDACLGTIPGAINACCGHGVVSEAYIQFEDGSRISGVDALAFARKIAPEFGGNSCK